MSLKLRSKPELAGESDRLSLVRDLREGVPEETRSVSHNMLYLQQFVRKKSAAFLPQVQTLKAFSNDQVPPRDGHRLLAARATVRATVRATRGRREVCSMDARPAGSKR